MARPVQQSRAQSGGNRGATGSNVVGQGTTVRQFAIDEHTPDREGQAVVRGTILLHSSCARVALVYCLIPALHCLLSLILLLLILD